MTHPLPSKDKWAISLEGHDPQDPPTILSFFEGESSLYDWACHRQPTKCILRVRPGKLTNHKRFYKQSFVKTSNEEEKWKIYNTTFRGPHDSINQTSHQWHLRDCNIIHTLLDNGVMGTSKRRVIHVNFSFFFLITNECSNYPIQTCILFFLWEVSEI